jgi:hypothetical protein
MAAGTPSQISLWLAFTAISIVAGRSTKAVGKRYKTKPTN